MIEHIYTVETSEQEDIYLDIPMADIAWFLCWFEKTKNHYHVKSYLWKFIKKIDEECICRKFDLNKVVIKIILRRRDDR